MKHQAQPTSQPADQLLVPREAAAVVRLSVPAFWRGVRDGRLPSPVYVSARSPRWFQSELIAAVRQMRMLPSEAIAARRINKLAKQAA